jgi:dephospho-CoA kinase
LRNQSAKAASSKSHRTLRIGVTGGIGSGKSTVCRLFERLGVPVLYADALAHDIANHNTAARKALLKLLGDHAYRSDGTLDRPAVASRVFSDKRLQKQLNDIVHPLVRRELRSRMKELAGVGEPLVMVEAALIFEAGLEEDLDAVILVDADEDTRLQRVVERDRVNPSDVKKRMNAQWKAERLRKHADFVLINDGSKKDLETKVRFLYSLFRSMLESHT